MSHMALLPGTIFGVQKKMISLFEIVEEKDFLLSVYRDFPQACNFVDSVNYY